VIHANRYHKHAPLRPFVTKAWPHYRRMQGFMPGAQPRGTHSFDPGSSSSASATQALNEVNAENDGEEDRAGPPVGTPMADVPAAFTLAMSSLFPPPPDTVSESLDGNSQSSNVMPPPFGSGGNVMPPPFGSGGNAMPPRPPFGSSSNAMPPRPPFGSSSDTMPPFGSSSDAMPPFGSSSDAMPPFGSHSDAMPPPFSSSISPTTHGPHSQKTHVSVFSALSSTSHSTSSGTRTPTTSSKRKRKRDATGDMPSASSKRTSKNKTDTMNPVIISSQLNSTITRLVDVMEKSLDVTATSVEIPTTHPSSSHTSSIPTQLPAPSSTLSSTSSSDSEVLDKALAIVTADRDRDSLSEDDLLAASLLFSNTSIEVVRIARTFIALSKTPSVQHRFLVLQLKKAGLHVGKGKGRAIVDDDDDFPMFE
jgi:hypothetical protein